MTRPRRDSGAAWEDAAEFQPLRELIERALVTYDWGESFVVTNVVIKPHDRPPRQPGDRGHARDRQRRPDPASIHFSLDEDARWHREWTAALIRHIVDDNTANAEVVSGWIEKWSPLASEALEAFASVTAEAPVPSDPSVVAARITDEVSRELGAALKR